jgi:O-antigen/teichoic acid export membrane protein
MKIRGSVLDSFYKYKVPIVYGSSTTISSIISMLTGILMIKWVTPSDLGIWQSISILQLYFPILEMGIPNGLNRELPFEYGKNNYRRAIDLAKTSQSFMIGISLLFLFLGSISSIGLYIFAFEEKYVFSILAIGILLSMNSYQRYLTVTYRSNQSFLNLSRVYLYNCVIQIVLFPIVYFLSFWGLVIYTVLNMFFFTCIMHMYRPIKEKPSFQLILFKELSRTGLPVFFINYLRGVSQSFNRVILLSYGGVLSVGLFTPVQAVNTLISILPGILGNFLFPKFNFELGKTNNPSLFWPIVRKINILFFLISVPFIILVFFLTPLVIIPYFPAYKSSILAIQVFSLAFLFSGTLVTHNVIYTLKAYKIAYVFIFCELILFYFLPLLFVKLEFFDLLVNISLGYVMAVFFLFFLNLAIIRTLLYKKNK